MQHSPVVSILIPCYNSERYIKRTIESALQQSWGNKEIIIVDDGSIDNTLLIAKSFESNKNVKVFTQNNGGACMARNRAFSESIGDYIQYLDADDLLSPDKVRYQMELVASSDKNAVFSCPWVRFYRDEDIENIGVPKSFMDHDWDNPVDWLINTWKGKGMAQTSVWLTPRHLIEKVGPWDERLSVNQDGEFFCRILAVTSTIKFTNKSVVYYRSGNDQSVSQRRSVQKISDLLLSYKLYADNVLPRLDTKGVRKALAINYLSYIYLYDHLYPDLSRQAREYLKSLNLNDYPRVGGRLFKLISLFLGFDITLKLKSRFKF